MPYPRIVTLLSDFGWSDVYVSVMKGVIAQIDSSLSVIDLTHQIPPQNLAAARFNLMNAYPYFPQGTTHVAVVDPGVGSQRRAIAVQLEGGFLVGPDNGIFSGILSQHSIVAAVELTNSQYWRSPNPSTTFHGRDIFAPVGAHLATGIPIEYLGTTIEPSTLIELPLADCQVADSVITGHIQYIDRFGNLITTIPGVAVEGKHWYLNIGDRLIAASQAYSAHQPLEIVVLVGSHGWIEIAVNCGSAQSQLQLNWGDKVKIELEV